MDSTYMYVHLWGDVMVDTNTPCTLGDCLTSRPGVRGLGNCVFYLFMHISMPH